MATYWVKSSGSWAANPGGTGHYPATAGTSFTSIANAIGNTPAPASGDIVRVSDASAESHSTLVNWNTSGTTSANDPIRMYCCADATGNAVTALPASAQVTSTTANDSLNIQDNWYIWGLRMDISGDVIIGAASQNAVVQFEMCEFRLGSGDNNESIYPQSDSAVKLLNCTVQDFNFTVQTEDSDAEIIDCTWVRGTRTILGTLFDVDSGTTGGCIRVRGGDFSAFNPGTPYLCKVNAPDNSFVEIIGARIPSGITLLEAAVTGGGYALIAGCGNGDQYYQRHHETKEGYAAVDTAVYRNAKYDGTNGYSIKMVMNAITTPEFSVPIRTKIGRFFLGTGGSKTVTVYFIRTDSTTLLQDDEIWFEIEYPDSTNQSHRKRDYSIRASSPDATPANHTDDDAGTAWTGRGATYKQHKASSGAISMGAGEIVVYACMAKNAQTVYVEPEFDVV